MLRHDRIAVPRERDRSSGGQIGTRECVEQRRDELVAGAPRGAARIASRATTGVLVPIRRVEQVGESPPARRRARAPPDVDPPRRHPPTLRPSPSRMNRAASRFCDGPGEARNAASPARIEKSSTSPELFELTQRIERRISRVTYSSASVLTPRSRSRSSVRRARGDRQVPRSALSIASARRRMSASGGRAAPGPSARPR